MIPMHKPLTAVALALLALGAAQAQNPVRPPLAQAWIDVATFSGMGMPMMGGGSGGMMSMPIGSLFGGGGGKNQFGHTQTGSAGRWVDVTLYSRQNPSIAEATQAVPAAFMDSALKLQPPRDARAAPVERDDHVVEHEQERPRGRLLLYWGCGATIRAGQPRVLDMATATVGDLGRFFQGRRATQRGAHSASGRPLWPNPNDARMLPAGASLVGEHAFSGAGVPPSFRFQIPAAQVL